MNVFELVDEHYKMQQGGTWEKQQAKVKAEKDAKLKLLLQDKDFLNNLKEQSKSNKNKEVNLKSSDATKVVIKNRPELTSKVARNKTDQEIADERQYIREQSNKNPLNTFSGIIQPSNWTRENLSDSAKGLESQYRVSDKPNFFDDWVNPANMIGNMASNLGQSPLQAQQSDSILPYITSIGTPLAVGAFAGIGANSTGQFVNNLANPLAGFGLKDKALDAVRIGKEIIQNPKVVIGETLKEIKRLPNQAEQVYHTFMDRNKPLYKIGSDNLENALESKIKNLQTNEGFNRLFNQELEITRNINPYSRERDLIEKANKNANARIDELSQTENLNKSFLNAKLEYPNINVNPFLDFGIPKNNAHFQGSYNNAINLDFLKKVNKDFVLDEGAVKPGKIAIGKEYAEDIGVFDHEINHALQNGRQTKIDRDIIEHFSNLENRKNGLTPKKRSSNSDESALSYLLTGSKGKEPSSFLAEARQAMLNKGLIKDIYEPITPDIIEKSMQYFSKNPIKNKYTKSSSTRIFDIANKNSAEFLANQMNKLPAILPIAGASYLATQGQEEPKKFQQGAKYPPISNFYKDKAQEKIPSREDNNIQLLINETNLAKQDKEEFNRTGQIKNPRSLHYKKLIPKQSEVKQDNISTEQRNTQLSPLQRPLIYLASPEKVLGDIGVPNMETSELDRQAVAKNTFNPNQTREERFLNNAKLGIGYVPEATINTALAAAFMPEGTGALGLVNETLNPLAGINTSISDELRQGLQSNGFLDMFKKAKPTINLEAPIINNINTPLVNVSKNLEDLNYAKEWAKQYGYELPQNLERVSKSNELTNRTIRGMMDRHNTFVRGVSTNWDELEKRNPEILRHLEGKGFNLSTKEGTKQAAEYMSTHVPIDTGYGRASLNDQVFDRGQDAIYTSNSIPTAEGYTYGQGYITKVKKPTDFSSANRQDWITQNNPTYYKNSLPKSRSYSVRDLDNLTNEKINDLLSQKRIDEADYGKILNYWNESKKIKKDLMGRYKINESTPDDVFDNYLDELNKEKENLSKNLFYEDYSNKILRTEKKTLNESTLQNDLLPIFRQFPESKANFKDFVKNHSLNDDILNSAEGDKWFRKFATENNYLTNDNPYAHYLHIGTPGEKILEPVKSWEITPDIWKNKSRAHTNEYSKKLSALSIVPIAGASYLATQGQQEQNPPQYQQGGTHTDNEKKFIDELVRLKLI